MILNGNDIKKLVEEKDLINPFNVDNVNSGSYDISVSSTILKIKKSFKVIDLNNSEQISKMYEEVDIKNGYCLKPNETILCALNEKISLPENIVAHIRPRTSLSRLGLYINLQHAQAGYSGVLNIAMHNMSCNSYRITPNLRIGQVVFEELTDGMTEDLLYQNESTPVYQDEDGLVGSKIYVDYIGKVFRHYKGNYYFIENISMDSETKEDMIVYRPLYERKDSMLWNRPAKMFFEEIDPNKKDNITGQKHRFELCEELSKDYINSKEVKKNERS